ncbi:hypothetical protein A0H81_04790 [Grifola frondosa]|uniref:Uncharacterized protein n=1 Tax=Grifola frondosa TaxID=5627 RepID=A0A1C7MH86_GRIFR|nr:hypothetical protein A0H81_04790 [Grifola frondosa]
MLRLVILALFLSSVVETVLSRLELPSELYTPLIADKILQRAISTPNPMQYPQYTDRVAGDWIWFSPDLWTTGFFPSTLYAMYARAQLCPWTTGEASKWLSLGRQWSAAELPLEIKNSVGTMLVS